MTIKRRQRLVLTATILGSAVAILDGTIVNLALPKIAADLHVGFSVLQWITGGYLLTLSSLILLGGSLGDIFGRKKVYLLGVIGFGLSSLLCAVAPTAGTLVSFRLLQGVFGALLVPGALSIINTNFPFQERGQAIGRWTAWSSIATLIGPFVGGTILNVTSWRWIFLINLPLLAICFVAAVAGITESRDNESRRVDWWGALLAVVGLGGITFGLIQGPVTYWSFGTIASLVAGLAASVLFIWVEAHRRDPMVQLGLFRSRNFSGSNLMTFGVYGALGGLIFALVIYLQTSLGYSSLQAGLTMLPVSIMMFLFAGRVGGLSARLGPRFFMTAGPLLVATGIGWLYFLQPGSQYLTSVLPGMLLFSIGLVLTVAPLTTTVMSSVPQHDSGIASGVNNAVARAAGLIVIAVLGLFGTQHVFKFAMMLCAGLAAAAGITSFFMIKNMRLKKTSNKLAPLKI